MNASRHLPAVSVLMPVRQAQHDYLAEAARSVLEQSVDRLELVVVEAESPLPAKSVLERFGDSRVVHHVLPSTTSIVDRLNFGLTQSRAPIIARMDADDICRPERLRLQLEFLESNLAIGVLGTQIDLIDAQGKPLGRRRFPRDHEQIVAALRRKNPISHPTVAIRRETMEAVGGYQHPERPAQDYDLWCRLALNGTRFANFDHALLEYRLHANSVKAQRLRETLRATIAIKEMYWRGRLDPLDRVRLNAERLALALPPSLVYRIFGWFEYGVRPAVG